MGKAQGQALQYAETNSPSIPEKLHARMREPASLPSSSFASQNPSRILAKFGTMLRPSAVLPMQWGDVPCLSREVPVRLGSSQDQNAKHLLFVPKVGDSECLMQRRGDRVNHAVREGESHGSFQPTNEEMLHALGDWRKSWMWRS